MSDHHQASCRHSHDFSDHFLPAGEAEAPPLTTVPLSSSAPPPHPIFRPAANPLPPPGQPLAPSSAVPPFALPVLPVPPAAPRAYDHPPSVRTISDQAYANMPRFPINGPRAAAHFHNLIVNER
ncbi:hypothetical protein BDDG_08329 [Blastomyces dermatitidis ATCC 18188]|uniref:Uncharacterized protein n=1 Tax=Ajellomyces dermatitidis (strain ATCC 18188 / CBS 674.68) TaxID=653446 RepID=F2TQ71_AJEDA|nr:hypothetical protein BDDG_08329 [Blastomyces dermatitidis ATCC 18188]